MGMNTKLGLHRLLTMSWWLLWPTALPLIAWAEYIDLHKGSGDDLFYLVPCWFIFMCLNEMRKNSSDMTSYDSISTIVMGSVWLILVSALYVFPLAVLQVLTIGANFRIVMISLTVAYVALIVVLCGLGWVVDGLATKSD